MEAKAHLAQNGVTSHNNIENIFESAQIMMNMQENTKQKGVFFPSLS